MNKYMYTLIKKNTMAIAEFFCQSKEVQTSIHDDGSYYVVVSKKNIFDFQFKGPVHI